MDWSNRFTLGGFTVTYCTFQMAWEVVEDRDGYDPAFRWFSTRKEALLHVGLRNIFCVSCITEDGLIIALFIALLKYPNLLISLYPAHRTSDS
ncbi:uncharacterized protein METZ01_LOCUS228347 [marine metagenome]|uniref:Uncharacterized protein n=1 Tax=marine metagenome TaxID=408172 RepID=A0A382GLL4_9ZZZZ